MPISRYKKGDYVILTNSCQGWAKGFAVRVVNPNKVKKRKIEVCDPIVYDNAITVENDITERRKYTKLISSKYLRPVKSCPIK